MAKKRGEEESNEDLTAVLKYLEVLDSVKPGTPTSGTRPEKNERLNALKAEYPARIQMLEEEWLPAVPAPCESGKWEGRSTTPCINLLGCYDLCARCLQEARKGLRHIAAHLRGEDPGEFIDAATLNIRLQRATPRLEARSRAPMPVATQFERIPGGGLRAVRGRDAPGAQATEPRALSERKPKISHAADFSWVRRGDELFNFTTPQQRAMITALYKSWEEGGDGASLSTEHLREVTGSSAFDFRIDKVFKNHPVRECVLRPVGKGNWALYLNESLHE